ncbi:MAG: SDR family oxidoreductase, partial [Chromatocurvus sp.]
SRGLGFEAALAFARHGDRVYASMRDRSAAEPLIQAARSESLDVRTLVLDVSQPQTFTAVVEEVTGEAGRLDVLVNNAGIVKTAAFEDTSEQDLRQVMETNFFGPMLLARAVLPVMRAQGSGRIIMMGSLSGIAGLPVDVAYTASKFALEGATEALRHEVDRWGIKVALVEAGMYATGIFAGSLEGAAELPPAYPPDSAYLPLVKSRLQEVRKSLESAFPPSLVANLFVKIAHSDEPRLRWPADEVARSVLETMFAQDDSARDAFLREVAGTDWWSEGREAPEGP